MIVKIFSIYDSKVEAYLRPFFEATAGSAIRAVSDEVNSRNEKSGFCKHPEDYVLFELGTYDDSNANFNVYSAPKSLGVLSEFVVSTA